MRIDADTILPSSFCLSNVLLAKRLVFFLTTPAEDFALEADFSSPRTRLWFAGPGVSRTSRNGRLAEPVDMSEFIPVTDVTARTPLMAIPLHRRAGGASNEMNATNHLRAESVPGLLLGGDRLGTTYDEDTFRYFLSLEEKRSDRSNRPLLLVLVELKKEDAGKRLRFEPRIAGELFTALRACLRETDFVGWHRDGHVAGAVLTHIGDTADADVSALISQRVGEALCGRLPAHVASRLQVLVHQVSPASDRS
jgi:hypothetical protein